MDYTDIGLHVPTILLPRPDVPMPSWAVVACDQYTWQPEYWQQVETLVDGNPSTLHLIYPEVYLGAPDEDDRIGRVQATMSAYLDQGVLQPQPPGFVLVERQLAAAGTRRGLVVALDLEHYDYHQGAGTLIRATEGTLVDRLPPRIRIREHAPVEAPHIMVLIDDPEHTVIEPLFERSLPSLYDFELMQGGGRVRGFQVADAALIEQVAQRLAALAEPQAFADRYGVDAAAPLLYAMGDGNHSLATAKAIWDRLKEGAGAGIMEHPARYALVELINVHDPGLAFEPIHRVVMDADLTVLFQAMEAFYCHRSIAFTRRMFPDREAWQRAGDDFPDARHCIHFLAGGEYGILWIDDPYHHLEVASLQAFLDAFLTAHPEAGLDYVHGQAAVSELGAQPRHAGFFFPAADKFDLFRTILLDGAFPRKTFSMGEADEKRYYIECRRIAP